MTRLCSVLSLGNVQVARRGPCAVEMHHEALGAKWRGLMVEMTWLWLHILDLEVLQYHIVPSTG